MFVSSDHVQLTGSMECYNFAQAVFGPDGFEPVGSAVFADYLDEHGRPVLAYAYRWMQRRGFWPHNRTHYYDLQDAPVRSVPAAYSWAWYKLGSLRSWEMRREKINDHAILPPAVFQLSGGHRFFGTHLEAVQHLALLLESLRIGYLLDLHSDPRAGGKSA